MIISRAIAKTGRKPRLCGNLLRQRQARDGARFFERTRIYKDLMTDGECFSCINGARSREMAH